MVEMGSSHTPSYQPLAPRDNDSPEVDDSASPARLPTVPPLRRSWHWFRHHVRRSLDGQLTGMALRWCHAGLRRVSRHVFARIAPLVGQVSAPEDSVQASSTVTAPPPPSPVRRKLSLTSLQERFEARRDARLKRQEKLIAALPKQTAGDTACPAEGVAPSPEKSPTPAVVPAEDTHLAASQPDAAPARNTSVGRDPAFPYQLPSADLLCPPAEKHSADPKELRRAKRIIQDTLDSFGIDAEVGEATRGPRVTLFEVNPARGVRVEVVSSIGNNLAMELSAVSLRILAPVPGEDFIGLEVPNRHGDTVSCRELIESDLWQKTRAHLPLIVGKNIRGSDVVLDLTRAPHLLIAGATGSGKSVCLNTMLMSLLFRFTPDELQLILIDPKVVEFSIYNRLPHLIVPVITDTPDVVMALGWLVREMERRYRLLAKVGARNLDGFNHRPPEPEAIKDDDGVPIPARLPFIVLIIDELADIILTAREQVERNLTRIAQMSRAVGIHTIIATQRPSVNIITGIIKANYPTRIAFQVSSQIDSRTILDTKGAEALLGRGDMLFRPPDGSRSQRLQGVFVEDEEIERVVEHVSQQAGQTFDEAVLRPLESDLPALEAGDELDAEEERLVEAALDIIVRDRRASTSYIQRRLRIGYNRAASIIETLALRGVLGPQIGSAPREILVDESGVQVDDWTE